MKQKLWAGVTAAAVLLVAVSAFCVVFPASADMVPTQLTAANANLVPDAGENLLATAQLVVTSGVSNGCSSGYGNAFDGWIPGANSAASGSNLKADFQTSGLAQKSDGTAWNGAAGWSTLIFRLEGTAELRQFLIAGSAAEAEKFSYQGTTVNNKHVIYYEIYAADTQDSLFSAESLVTSYDNSETGGLCQLFTLENALVARYVGFKMVGGAYNLARIGELGAYGVLSSDAYTALDSAAAMAQAVNGKVNLLNGAAVQNKPCDNRLVMEGLSQYTGDEALLTDGQVNWTESDGVVTYTHGDSNRPYFDLRGTASLTGALVVSGYAGEGEGIRYFRVYASDSRDAVFADDSLAAVVRLGGSCQGGYVPLSHVSGRYVGFDVIGMSGNEVSVAELGVYGSYTGEVEPYVYSLIRGKKPVQIWQIPARGIDNKTAVSAAGAAGTGNTGAFAAFSSPQSVSGIEYLTDGLNDKRTNIAVRGSEVHTLAYDTPWIVLTYDLGGLCEVSRLRLDSYWLNGDGAYSVGGLQFYASANHADLFKNESLLYTSGGEKYTTDGQGNFIPDESAKLPGQEVFTYTLSAAQRATQVRFVSLVITRPYNYLYANGSMILGYNQSRLAELIVEGSMITADAPIVRNFTVASSKGDIQIGIQQKTLDDRDFFTHLQGWRLTEETLSAGVNPHEVTGWLTADGDTVFHLELLDKSGNVVTDLDGRTVTVALPTGAEYTQSAGQIVNNEIQRFYNAYNHADGYIYIGSENYPAYEEGVVNNRDRAFVLSGDVRLVYLKYRDGREIKAQEGTVYHESLFEFQDTGAATAKGGAAK